MRARMDAYRSMETRSKRNMFWKLRQVASKSCPSGVNPGGELAGQLGGGQLGGGSYRGQFGGVNRGLMSIGSMPASDQWICECCCRSPRGVRDEGRGRARAQWATKRRVAVAGARDEYARAGGAMHGTSMWDEMRRRVHRDCTKAAVVLHRLKCAVCDSAEELGMDSEAASAARRSRRTTDAGYLRGDVPFGDCSRIPRL